MKAKYQALYPKVRNNFLAQRLRVISCKGEYERGSGCTDPMDPTTRNSNRFTEETPWKDEVATRILQRFDVLDALLSSRFVFSADVATATFPGGGWFIQKDLPLSRGYGRLIGFVPPFKYHPKLLINGVQQTHHDTYMVLEDAGRWFFHDFTFDKKSLSIDNLAFDPCGIGSCVQHGKFELLQVQVQEEPFDEYLGWSGADGWHNCRIPGAAANVAGAVEYLECTGTESATVKLHEAAFEWEAGAFSKFRQFKFTRHGDRMYKVSQSTSLT